MKRKFELSRERKDDLIGEIKTFFEQERNEEIGDLAATIVLDFFMDKIATEFYNQGVFDSYKYIQERADDLLEIQK